MVAEIFISGLDSFFNLNPVLMTMVGVFIGLVLGVLPGVGPLLGVILFTPAAMYVDPIAGMGMLVGIYVGGACGGAISAILLRIPGTPMAAATLLDGYPMAKKGKAPQAVGLAISASALGGMFGGVCLILFCPLLAQVAVKFTPPEYFALTLTGLISIAVVAKESTIKGLISGCIGLFTANIGMDPFCEYYRFTFDIDALLGGINLVSLLVGLFALSEMFMQMEKGGLDIKPHIKIFRAPLSSIREVLGRILNLLRSSSIGTFIGALPGAGMVIASFISYAMAKAASKNPKEFGTGAKDGIIAAEAGNNSCCGGALIPTLAMAIPGDPTSACLLSALLLLGFFPGPELFNNHKDVVGGIFLAYMSANFFLLLLGILLTPFFVAILKLKKNRLIPIILLLATIGTYALESSIFDLELMIFFGLLGYLMRRNGFPMAPLIIAHVLGPLMETNFRRALIISDERLDIFFTRPLCATILAINALLLLWTMLPPAMLSRIRKHVWRLILPKT